MNKDASNMKRNPKETANIFSQLFFGWMLNLFVKGAKRDLKESDIYRPLKVDRSEKVADHLEKYWNRELEKLKKMEYTVGKDGQKVPLKSNARPRLYKAIIRAFWLPYFTVGIFVLIETIAVDTLQPILQGYVIDYFSESASNKFNKNQTLIYAGCLIISIVAGVLITHHCTLKFSQIGMRVRIACSSLLYRKLLRLNRTSLNQTGAGHMVNLLSNDVNRFDLITVYLNYIWIMPIQIVIIGYVIWNIIGVLVFVGFGILIICILIQGTLGLISNNLRATIAPLTDRRVQLMNELIAGIQVVKMHAWEKPFSKIVSITRKLELSKIKFSLYVHAAYVAFIIFTDRIILYFTLITFVLMGNNLSATITYVLMSLFNSLQISTVNYFSQALIMVGETLVSINRLEEFLLMDEVNMECLEIEPQLQSMPNNFETTITKSRTGNCVSNDTLRPGVQKKCECPVGVEFQHVFTNWINGQLPPTLCNICMKIKPGQLCILLGAVGSGKSSVLHLLLRELNLGAGHIIVSQDTSKTARSKLSDGYVVDIPNLHISYAGQEAWLFGGTVRNNILFGQPYDKIKYMQVTNVCALTKDFQQLPQGDMTIVGDRGVSLSGGQRSRVNLARAVYRQADLYLFDDPLSAVDTHVAKQLYNKCITDYLAGKTRILVTHQLQFLKQADHIIILDRGFVKMQGNYNALMKSNKDFIDIIDSLMMNHQAQKKEENARQISEISIRKSSTLIQRSSRSSITSSIAYSGVDDFDWRENDLDGEEMAHSMMPSKVYTEYFHHGANYFVLFMLLFVFVIGQIATTGNDYWVSYWTNLEELRQSEGTVDANHTHSDMHSSFLATIFTPGEDGLLNTTSAIYVYTFCILICIATVLLRSFFYMKVCTNSNRNLHNAMFSNLVHARMSFFNTNLSGRILNRFSKDIGTMDELLAKTMLETLQSVCILCAVLIMEAIINYWMLIPIVILIVLLIPITKIYVRIAQNLKHVEGISKSPMFSHVNSTFNGLSIIRSNDAKMMMQKQFDALQDYHSGAWYLTIVCTTVFGLFVDLIMCMFVACVTFSFILMNESSLSSAKLGLTISQAMILMGMVQYSVRQTGETISLMTSVERVLQYTNLPLEERIISKNPAPPTWPTKGRITLKNISMKYDTNNPPVLKNLNVSIEPGWKVGVVGRTGAGKSSLIAALFRLFDEGLEGEMKIDGRDTSTVGLQELRSKISIIPQDPVLFSKSLRFNLDPFNQFNDILLWEVLRKVKLNDVALDQNVLCCGHNFSMGQRQLICLARTILRNNRLLVLDEAMANIDSHTDALIQDTIRANFKECTMIIIAHRLNTIIDSHRVIVMEDGYIVEFGCPYELLCDKPNGYFSQMVQKTGSQMAQSLFEQAKKACRKNNDDHNSDLSTQSFNESDITISEITEQSYL